MVHLSDSEELHINPLLVSHASSSSRPERNAASLYGLRDVLCVPEFLVKLHHFTLSLTNYSLPLTTC